MKKVYNLSDLDCANCASKMESNISKIEGVKNISVNFMTQKLTIEIEEDKNMDEIMNEVKKVCHKVEPDCTILD